MIPTEAVTDVVPDLPKRPISNPERGRSPFPSGCIRDAEGARAHEQAVPHRRLPIVSISPTARAATARPNGRGGFREHVLTTNDLIWPLFLIDGEKRRVPVAAMPGVDRLSVDEAVREAERAVELDIPAIAFFPYTEPELKDERGSEAFNDGNLVCQACRAIKREFPQLGLVTDVALDPYTSHGHDGLISESATARSASSTTRRSRRWCARRSTRRAPAPTSSRPPT